MERRPTRLALSNSGTRVSAFDSPFDGPAGRRHSARVSLRFRRGGQRALRDLLAHARWASRADMAAEHACSRVLRANGSVGTDASLFCVLYVCSFGLRIPRGEALGISARHDASGGQSRGRYRQCSPRDRTSCVGRRTRCRPAPLVSVFTQGEELLRAQAKRS